MLTAGAEIKLDKIETEEAAPQEALPLRPHGKMALPGIIRFVILFLWELTSNIPSMIALRFWYRKQKRAKSREPMVACIGDNLDEVNGIAISSRIMLRKLRERGKPAFLFGIAFHSKSPRSEGADESVVMAPGRYSLPQAGYPVSEVTLMRIEPFIRFLRKHPVDVIEFQTPGPVTVLCLITAKIAGIKTLSHYRTDIITYSKMLVDNRLGVWFINTWTKVVTRITGPVVVPSMAYHDKVREMGVPESRIFKLPRGVDFENFHPSRSRNGAWQELGLPSDGVKLLYVGRISREKNLELLAEVFSMLAQKNGQLSLTVVGDGPYRKQMEEKLSAVGRVHFTGVAHGEKLAGLFASADIMVFPSLTDTFGNSVVEALASGIPCVTSNHGGPREIIVDGESGLIFDHERPGDLAEKILHLADHPERLLAFKAAARERAMLFTYDRAAQGFWDFYCRYFNNQI